MNEWDDKLKEIKIRTLLKKCSKITLEFLFFRISCECLRREALKKEEMVRMLNMAEFAIETLKKPDIRIAGGGTTLRDWFDFLLNKSE